MVSIDGPPLPVIALLARAPLDDALLCALGVAAIALALRLASIVLRLVARAALAGALLLIALSALGLVIPLPPIPNAALDLARRGAGAVYRAAITDRAPAWLAGAARRTEAGRTQTPASPAAWVTVAHTGGDGVYLHTTPRMADRLVAWSDGTRLQVAGDDVIGDGHRWTLVRDPAGQLGWVAADYLVPIGGP